MKILHITTHMGGGVGRAITDILLADQKNKNSIVLLENPEKKHNIDECIAGGIEVHCEMTIAQIKQLICDNEIVILHWWHHPLMCKFMYQLGFVRTRLVLWVHVSGCTYPYMSYDFTVLFHALFLTSRYSFENKYWNHVQRNHIEKKSNIVYGLGKIAKMRSKPEYSIKANEFRIGYVGTLSKSKIAPDFLDKCLRVLNKVPCARFYLIGDAENSEWIQKEAKVLGILEYFFFLGYVDDVNEKLLEFDVFGYPLNPYHYGTTENSILEAMAVGLPVVAMNQATEKYIITDGKDGLLAENNEQYAEAMELLYNSKQLREDLGRTARNNVLSKFSFKDNMEQFQKCVERVNTQAPQEVTFKNVLGVTPYQWFISAVNNDDKCKINEQCVEKFEYIFLERTKSSVQHFAKYYSYDSKLTEYKKLVESYINN